MTRHDQTTSDQRPATNRRLRRTRLRAARLRHRCRGSGEVRGRRRRPQPDLHRRVALRRAGRSRARPPFRGVRVPVARGRARVVPAEPLRQPARTPGVGVLRAGDGRRRRPHAFVHLRPLREARPRLRGERGAVLQRRRRDRRARAHAPELPARDEERRHRHRREAREAARPQVRDGRLGRDRADPGAREADHARHVLEVQRAEQELPQRQGDGDQVGLPGHRRPGDDVDLLPVGDADEPLRRRLARRRQDERQPREHRLAERPPHLPRLRARDRARRRPPARPPGRLGGERKTARRLDRSATATLRCVVASGIAHSRCSALRSPRDEARFITAPPSGSRTCSPNASPRTTPPSARRARQLWRCR